MDADGDSTSTTELQDDSDIGATQANVSEEDNSRCRYCGRNAISIEEAERITQAEAATFVQLHAPKIIELETIKFNAKQRKLNGPGALRKLKSTVGSKKTQ